MMIAQKPSVASNSAPGTKIAAPKMPNPAIMNTSGDVPDPRVWKIRHRHTPAKNCKKHRGRLNRSVWSNVDCPKTIMMTHSRAMLTQSPANAPAMPSSFATTQSIRGNKMYAAHSVLIDQAGKFHASGLAKPHDCIRKIDATNECQSSVSGDQFFVGRT